MTNAEKVVEHEQWRRAAARVRREGREVEVRVLGWWASLWDLLIEFGWLVRLVPSTVVQSVRIGIRRLGTAVVRVIGNAG